MEFELTREPEWLYDEICACYSFKAIGNLPNQLLMASVLAPRTEKGHHDPNARILLAILMYRFHVAKVRSDRVDDPVFGPYRYTWATHEKLAAQAALSESQVKRGLAALVEGGIIYRARQNNYEPTSYRLTDPAFQMAHALQFPVLKAKWLAANIKAKQASVAVFREWAGRVEKNYPSWFAEWVPSKTSTWGKWHCSSDAHGNRLTPGAFGLTEELDAHLDKLISEEFEVVLEDT